MDGGLQTPTTLRPVRPISLHGIEPRIADTSPPTLELVDPRELVVDDGYQRSISEKSINLIRRIVAEWDWRRFKPPITARRDGALMVIDGQHTAIAAASHPAVLRIPVMVVEADSMADQARAFVGHNRDRVALTPCQIYYAALAAGDKSAVDIAACCSGAGLRVLRTPPANGIYQPGDTVALAALGKLVERYTVEKAIELLKILTDAGLAPVSADFIKAVEVLMTDAEYSGSVTPRSITGAILALGQEGAVREAKVFAAAHDTPTWRGLVVVLFRRARRGR